MNIQSIWRLFLTYWLFLTYQLFSSNETKHYMTVLNVWSELSTILIGPLLENPIQSSELVHSTDYLNITDSVPWDYMGLQ